MPGGRSIRDQQECQGRVTYGVNIVSVLADQCHVGDGCGREYRGCFRNIQPLGIINRGRRTTGRVDPASHNYPAKRVIN